MISIRKFLAVSETEQTLLRVVQLLLQGLGLHAVEAEPEEYARFQEDIRKISTAFEGEMAPQSILVEAGSAIKSLEQYNRRATRYLRMQTTELQSMVKMLTSAVSTISTGGDENVRRLSEIGNQVESVSQIQDVRLIKAQLSECLDLIRKETERQRAENEIMVAQLNQELDQGAHRNADVANVPVFDAVTGLPSRRAAEEALAKACETEAPIYAVAIVLDRIETFNARFGYEVGDEILRFVAQSLKRQVLRSDQLFRWTGPMLLALVERPGSLERARADIARIMDLKLEHTVQTSTRTILMPITTRWTLFRTMASLRLLTHKIDGFAKLRLSQE